MHIPTMWIIYSERCGAPFRAKWGAFPLQEYLHIPEAFENERFPLKEKEPFLQVQESEYFTRSNE